MSLGVPVSSSGNFKNFFPQQELFAIAVRLIIKHAEYNYTDFTKGKTA